MILNRIRTNEKASKNGDGYSTEDLRWEYLKGVFHGASGAFAAIGALITILATLFGVGK